MNPDLVQSIFSVDLVVRVILQGDRFGKHHCYTAAALLLVSIFNKLWNRNLMHFEVFEGGRLE